ncbi:MAG: hypothetical protein VYA54_02845 [Bdellovibrionota bacterium]|nr:hypothetical protein [Bdellovibrionota bacterium]
MKNTLLLIGSIFLILCAGLISQNNQKPELHISKQDTAINIQKEIIGLIFSSQKMLLSDIYWIGTLLESDLEHYKKNDLDNWIFHRFDTITHLDPKFYKAYLYGGQYLSIVKDDVRAAEIIYEKSLKYYPDDYNLLFNFAFLNAFELENYPKAITLYEKLMEFPKTPPYVISILHKLKYENQNFSLQDTYDSLASLFKTLNEDEDHLLYGRVEADLYRIKAQIDLACLNEGGKKCDKLDFKGKPYLRKNGKFRSEEDFVPYGIFKEKN